MLHTVTSCLSPKNDHELVEILRLYTLGTDLKSGAWSKDHDECKAAASQLVSACKGLQVEVQACFLRRPSGDRPFVALNGTTLTPIETPHPSSDGPLQPFATIVTGHKDVAAADRAWDSMAKAGILAQYLGTESTLASKRIERLRMGRVHAIMPQPLKLDVNRMYEIRAYTYPPFLNPDGTPGDADTRTYIEFMSQDFKPGFEKYTGCKLEAFWMRGMDPKLEPFTSSAAISNGTPYVNSPEDKPPSSIWITSWANDEQCERNMEKALSDPAFLKNLFVNNPYASYEPTFSPLYKYERVVEEFTTCVLK